ncbi:MAG: glycoside hydrolase family 2 protein, partial [Muribaculaceae bacterium]|nr:glycoside hydrolase family 2 protein [Muribaculaceae bacterium]
MKRNIIIACMAVSAVCAGAMESRQIDDDWLFSLDGGPWQCVDLPHDWSITFDFDSIATAGNDGGYLRTGKGVYRKTLRFSQKEAAGRHKLYLEGVYMNSTTIVNGDTVGFRPYGYSSMIYDISDRLRPGDNTIEIIADNSRQKNCRWYSGSGIYRHVRLLSSGPVYVSPWSVAVTSSDISEESATVTVRGEIDNTLSRECKADVCIDILRAGKPVASKTVAINASAAGTRAFEAVMTVPSPALWSPDSPALYEAVISVRSGGETVDTAKETFGIRDFAFDAEGGLRLNGKSIVLNGGCVHHDNGMLGAASFDAAEARKVRLMKDAGFNAVRTSHNPPSTAFLDECDRQGLIVIDESFDGWRDKKTEYDYARDFDSEWRRDIVSMVLRDRNHPSVFCWSIGNEVMERKKLEVVTTARKLASLCRSLDPSRPVTSALASWDSDWEIYDPLAAEHEIVGYNYMIHKSEGDHERVPDRVMWQTESYPRDAAANRRKVVENPYIIGDFVWTAIDYLGESGIGRYFYEGQTEGEHFQRDQWPWHGAYCGDIDITGLRKPISHYREALYSAAPSLFIAVREPDGYYGRIRETQWGVYPTWESWTWPGHEGRDIEVEVISRYPRVALYVNGRPAGESAMGEENDFRTLFRVPYEAGEVRA